MFIDFPQETILMVAGAFLIGWLLSSISKSIGGKLRARKRDPRDDRIRSLDAEVRIAQSDLKKAREKIESLEKDVEDGKEGNRKRDNVISHQQDRIESLSSDLKDSVLKTRELRNELSDRATENLKSEVKLREVETELEVAQASTDLIATGVLDFSLDADSEDEEPENRGEGSDVSKAAN
jgi:predicted RNase H-like nuclease (RuvC/YqgF family)